MAARFLRFETPEQEIRKVIGRLRFVGAMRSPRNARIIELFYGTGSGLTALHRLGFSEVQGVDLSPSLAAAYPGPGNILVADCRQLLFKAPSKHILIVQGGLYPLRVLPDDRDQAPTEAACVLTANGLLVVVEPWATLFLSVSHALCRSLLIRTLSSKIDARL